MKRLLVLVALLVLPAVPLTAWSGDTSTGEHAAPGKAATAPDSIAPHHVVAYYFHTTKRCVSCRKIEAWTHEALEQAFATELAEGRLVWRTVNIDEKDNKHFVEQYKLYTKSVVLVEERDGKEVRWANLSRVWQLLDRKDAFLWYIQGEARNYLAATAP